MKNKHECQQAVSSISESLCGQFVCVCLCVVSLCVVSLCVVSLCVSVCASSGMAEKVSLTSVTAGGQVKRLAGLTADDIADHMMASDALTATVTDVSGASTHAALTTLPDGQIGTDVHSYSWLRVCVRVRVRVRVGVRVNRNPRN